MTVSVLWLRQDVRLDHHAGWMLAKSLGEPVCATWFLPPEHGAPGVSGLDRYGAAKSRFWLDTLDVLQARLAPAGGLWTPLASPVSTLVRWHRLAPIRVLTCEAQAPDEADWLRQLIDAGVEVVTYGAQTLFDSEAALSVSRVSETFSQFRRRIERADMEPGPPPGMATTDALQWASAPAALSELPCARQWLAHRAGGGQRQAERHPAHRGGELAAGEWLESYLYSHHGLSHYKDSRNGLFGVTAGSHLSGYLATGALCPRLVWHTIVGWESRHGRNRHSDWLKQELLWREFFHWSLRQHGKQLFRVQGLNAQSRKPSPTINAQQREYWRRWCQAMTGIPFMDAALTELHTTGFVTNRVRQNLASFFIHDMGLDWRWGAEYFQHYLLDDDVASNWGNWAYIAGCGHDARGGRRFSIVKQLLRHDPSMAYVRHWLPALSGDADETLVTRHFEGRNGPYPQPMLRLPAHDRPDPEVPSMAVGQ